MKVALRLLQLDDVAAVNGIDLDEGDENLAGGNMATVSGRLRHRSDPQAHHPFLITVERKTVGFMMLREGPALPSWAPPDAISLHNFRISRQVQGRGYGTAALVLAARWIAVYRAEFSELVLSVNEENISAIRLYLRCGFRSSDLPFVGRLGTEFVLSCSVDELAQKHFAGG